MAGFAPNYGYDSENESLARKQKLAEAMMTGGLSPMELPQQPGVKASPLAAVAKLLQAYMGGKMGDQVADQRETLGRRYQADGKAGLEKLIEGISAQPGPTPAIEGNNPSAYVAPGMQTPQDVAGIKKRAIIEAMGSGHPMVQQIGMSQLKGLGEGQVAVKDLLPHAAPTAIPGMIRDGVSAFQPKPKEKKYGQVGGVVYDEDTMDIVQLRSPDGKPPAQVTINGDLYQVNQSTRKLEKLDNAPKISTTVNNNMPKMESEFQKYLGQAEGKRLSAAFEARPMQLEGIDAAATGKQLLAEGIHTGIMGNVRKDIDKLSGVVAKTDPAKAARTEEFLARMGDIVIPRLKDFGGSDTVEELKYLQKVNAGEITLEPQALSRVLTSVERKMRAKVAATDKTVGLLRKQGLVLPTFDESVMPPPVPQTPPAAPESAAPMTLDQYIKSKRGGR